MSAGELILYRSEDGRAEIQLRAEGDTVWLTQAEMAELFDTTPQAITQHIRAIYEEGELTPEATCKDSLQVRQEGQRQVRRRLKAYSLPMILAVGYRVRKQDVTIAKNYLSADEVDTLNRLVVIFLEQAELRAKERKDLTLDYWRHNVDRLLEFNERPVLDGAGSISRDRMEQIAHERYEQFDAQRRRDEALEADAEELRELEALEERVKKEKPQ
ncbi:RhuM family protein [Halorhodospira halochloris]|uniref:RhuM family protein n=1 Tax=Halorhodospira halochloris TaxID=1052 RepID=UPI001EE8B3CA|nr:RhuM family protein [Halorhodospira halochloris]MCG5549122.1 virulence RhuM family protein [Halorhodospira halochloris]